MPSPLRLHAHPANPVPPHWRVAVTLHWRDDSLELIYDWPADLRWPTAANGRADELWRHSCAELFVAAGAVSAYREFNFSPSGQWAIYDFDAYRQRAARLPDVPVPTLRREANALRVSVARAALPAGASQLGLTSVLEASDGSLSYWALAHPGAAPDFHHRAGFALAL